VEKGKALPPRREFPRGGNNRKKKTPRSADDNDNNAEHRRYVAATSHFGDAAEMSAKVRGRSYRLAGESRGKPSEGYSCRQLTGCAAIQSLRVSQLLRSSGEATPDFRTPDIVEILRVQAHQKFTKSKEEYHLQHTYYV